MATGAPRRIVVRPWASRGTVRNAASPDRSVVWRNGQAHFQGLHLDVWDSHGLSGHEFCAGTISKDSRGRWYLNVMVKRKPAACSESSKELSVYLNLRTFAGFSDEALANVEAQRFYRDLEPALALAQRAKRRDRAKAIHARIANRRKDCLHKLSTQLPSWYGAIFVGNVNAQAKGQHSKSVLDAGWSAFRTYRTTKALTQAHGSMRSMKRFPPRLDG